MQHVHILQEVQHVTRSEQKERSTRTRATESLRTPPFLVRAFIKALPYRGQNLIGKTALQFCFSQTLLYPTLSYHTKMLLSPDVSGLCAGIAILSTTVYSSSIISNLSSQLNNA